MRHAVIKLFLFTIFLIFGTTVVLRQSISQTDPVIDIIVQTGPQKNALPTVYLAELLGLSVDVPTLASEFDSKKGEEALLAHPLFSQIKITKHGSAVYIDYTLKQAVAYLGDFAPLAIDAEGTLFPERPYRPPQRIPKIILGLDECPTQISGPRWEIAKRIIGKIKNLNLRHLPTLQLIDLSQMEAQYLGRQEIVVLLDGGPRSNSKHYLRLSPKNYIRELTNYASLYQKLCKDTVREHVIDLRLTGFAYIQEHKKG